MRISRKLHLFSLVCFFLCPVAAMHGQASYFSESVAAAPFAGTAKICSNFSSTKLAISCSNSWEDTDSEAEVLAEGYEQAIAKNGFGTMSAYAYSFVTIVEQGTSAADSAQATEAIEDTLSLIGLEGQPTAFLKLDGECLQCAKYGNYAVAEYTFEASTSTVYSNICIIPVTVAGPLCANTIPIVYNVNTGQPYTIYLERGLTVSAPTDVVDGAAGATVTTTICVGSAGGCGTAGATVTASVVNAKGEVIKGVTVVGASRHIYN